MKRPAPPPLSGVRGRVWVSFVRDSARRKPLDIPFMKTSSPPDQRHGEQGRGLRGFARLGDDSRRQPALVASAFWGIEASSELIDWDETGTDENSEAADEFVDLNAGDLPSRFYRFRSVPGFGRSPTPPGLLVWPGSTRWHPNATNAIV